MKKEIPRETWFATGQNSIMMGPEQLRLGEQRDGRVIGRSSILGFGYPASRQQLAHFRPCGPLSVGGGGFADFVLSAADSRVEEEACRLFGQSTDS